MAEKLPPLVFDIENGYHYCTVASHLSSVIT
jgi:hypothetical protein